MKDYGRAGGLVREGNACHQHVCVSSLQNAHFSRHVGHTEASEVRRRYGRPVTRMDEKMHVRGLQMSKELGFVVLVRVVHSKCEV